MSHQRQQHGLRPGRKGDEMSEVRSYEGRGKYQRATPKELFDYRMWICETERKNLTEEIERLSALVESIQLDLAKCVIELSGVGAKELKWKRYAKRYKLCVPDANQGD
jgi:hypothetical protein